MRMIWEGRMYKELFIRGVRHFCHQYVVAFLPTGSSRKQDEFLSNRQLCTALFFDLFAIKIRV